MKSIRQKLLYSMNINDGLNITTVIEYLESYLKNVN